MKDAVKISGWVLFIGAIIGSIFAGAKLGPFIDVPSMIVVLFGIVGANFIHFGSEIKKHLGRDIKDNIFTFTGKVALPIGIIATIVGIFIMTDNIEYKDHESHSLVMIEMFKIAILPLMYASIIKVICDSINKVGE